MSLPYPLDWFVHLLGSPCGAKSRVYVSPQALADLVDAVNRTTLHTPANGTYAGKLFDVEVYVDSALAGRCMRLEDKK